MRSNAPGVRVAVVMSGHARLEELIPGERRAKLVGAGLLAQGASAQELRQMLVRANADFRD